MSLDLKSFISNYPDFPILGVLFRDISPLLYDVSARNQIIESFRNFITENHITTLAGIDARGFLLASMLAECYQLPLIMIRKKGKLPDEATMQASYDLEYGHATLTIRKDILKPTDKVLIIDDVLATGGTMAASIDLIQQCGVTEIAL
jgi:adenine phosphoribosyltransferase